MLGITKVGSSSSRRDPRRAEELIIVGGAQSDVQDKLHLGVFSGSLQLEHLQIRRDALTSLGASHHDPERFSTWGSPNHLRGSI